MLQTPSELQGLREISLFSGGGGGVLASKLLGLKTVAYVEWEKYPQKVLAARIKDGLIDEGPVFGDIREFNGTSYRGDVEVVSGGFPCFVAGTLVLTDEGYKVIEDVQVGDRVLTHRGRWRRVNAVMTKQNASVREIKAQGVPGIVCTDEHPFYVRFRDYTWNNARRRYVRRFGDPEWVDASELAVNEPGTPTSKVKSHFLGQVLPPERDDENTEAFWWLIGRYLADGWRVQRKDRPEGNGRVVISCNHNEADELEHRIKAAGYHATRSKERTATKFHIVRNDLFQMTEAFGHLAHGKHLNERILSLSADKARAVCEGYFSGDGCRQDNARGSGTHLSCSTVSKALALGMSLLAQRAYGVVASVRLVPTEDIKVIEGREVNQRDFYRVTIPERNKSAFIEEGYGWKNIRSNDPKGTATVFNIAVEEDESYVADGAIVHNCQPFSLAGKQAAQDDVRDMWPDTLRVITEVQPRYAFLENVPGLLSASHNYFSTILADLAAAGYEAVWDCIPASAVGAPHRRDRLWILARKAKPCDFAHVGLGLIAALQDGEWRDPVAVGDDATRAADWSRNGALLLNAEGEARTYRFPRLAFPEGVKTRYGVWPWPSILNRRDLSDVGDDEGRQMWMTPNTWDGVAPKSQEALDHEATHRKGRAAPNNLRDQVNVEEGNAEWKGLYPTPRANDWKGADLARDENRSGARHGGDDLATRGEKKQREMWPTPRTAMASMYAEDAETLAARGRDDLTTRVARIEKPTPAMMLNPDWVEWLMGWPIGWTRLEEQPPTEAWAASSVADTWWNEEPAGVSRVTSERTRRTPRLKALGNGQVALCAAAACSALFATFQQIDESVGRQAEGYEMGLDEFFDL